MPPDPPIAKLIMLGDSAVGKTSLLVRYTENSFSAQFLTTLGFDYRRKELVINGEALTLQIWDTAGQENFRSITKSYMRGADGAALVFDVTSRETFNRINAWIDTVTDTAVRPIDVVLIGNKIDAGSRSVTIEEGVAAASAFGVPYFEVSAKTGESVAEAFEHLARLVATHLTPSPQTIAPVEDTRCC
jgi:small GTP-binding protein